MNQSAYALTTFCLFGGLLAYDKCDTLEELKATFVDAYKYYLGRKPRESTIGKFMRNHQITAWNKIGYYFVF